jgi:hypothetical protein
MYDAGTVAAPRVSVRRGRRHLHNLITRTQMLVGATSTTCYKSARCAGKDCNTPTGHPCKHA